VDSENAAPRLLEFQRLIPDSVGIALRAADPADFLGWVRERLLNYAAPDSPLHGDTNLGRAMAFAWARAVWNGLVHCALPVSPQGLKRKPMPEPGRNDVQPGCERRRDDKRVVRRPVDDPKTLEMGAEQNDVAAQVFVDQMRIRRNRRERSGTLQVHLLETWHPIVLPMQQR